MKINTSELRKIIREELQKMAAPMLKSIVKETLIKNAINEVLVNFIAESIVDKQEALALMKEQIELPSLEREDSEIGTIRLSTQNLSPIPKSRLDEHQRAEIKSRYEQMMGGSIPYRQSSAAVPKTIEQESEDVDAQKVMSMLPETNTEGGVLRVNSLPDHLAKALTKDYRQILKDINVSVNSKR
jgi:hypothetical protein